ncbi:hypothetical protein O3P16_10665 [Chitinophagaceae bacterium LY-5]|uniref:Uncharacterized protein n=2 Tax=Polluticaenibacter yanchengensis TaxID=3014562 RepID=A0ABT4UKH9_9BACT|nr:hypothetical protein [Chitinophagaceae bacterium LY-5]
MEKVQSLIYRLQQQADAKATADELLFTTELLFQQLAKYANISVFTTGSVAVWLPKGMSAAGARNLVWQDKPSATQIQQALNNLPAEKAASSVAVVAETNPPINIPAQENNIITGNEEQLSDENEEDDVVVVMPETGLAPAQTSADPGVETGKDLLEFTLSEEADVAVNNVTDEKNYEDHVRHIVTPDSSIEVKPDEYTQPIINTSPDTEVFELSIDPDDEELKQIEQIEKFKKEEQERQLTQQEIEVPALEEEEYKPEPVVLVTPKPGTETETPKEEKSIFNGLFGNLPKSAADVVKNVFNNAANLVQHKATDTPGTEYKPIADTSEIPGINKTDKVSTELNERFKSSAAPGLSKIVTGNTEKINDLRKAFTINEKYQMIQSLFRGDEDMFERTLRTINNFETISESKYWIQRELVFKLGWNDEHELVQLFYNAVAKKFA